LEGISKKLTPNGIFKKHNDYKLKQSKNNKKKKILDEHKQTRREERILKKRKEQVEEIEDIRRGGFWG